jgi:rhamnose transport system substrate-binding protein
MPAQLTAPPDSATKARMQLSHEAILALLLVVEVAIFGFIGTNFFTRGNAAEITRLCVEVGLLSIAMTPVIITGGIDLSVGSLMGLSAVIFGILVQERGVPIPTAAALTLVGGALAGGLNALLITLLRLPPLIVTLGTYSLFRGLGEGITQGTKNYTGFPSSFEFLGQGYLPGGIPAQLPIFVVAAIAFWILLQRTTIGRTLYAIGFSPEGARHAGIPVERRIGLVYVLSGLVASLAAIIYVAHFGQAKSDAGTGYELSAITAVVLGGTSIFGGRGSIQGTVLGIFAIAVLQNGLRLADLPPELAGILMGLLLLATISIERLSSRRATAARASNTLATSGTLSGEFEVKNSQVALLSLVILAGALIVAGSNWVLVNGLKRELTSPGATSTSGKEARTTAPTAEKKITVAMMPKSKGNAYFVACHQGAEEAAKELGVDLIWDGPTDPDPAKQNEVIETWITRKVDVIAVAVENREGISSVLRKAREKGIKVITWDSDAQTDARDYFVNQATPQGIGSTLMDHAGRILKGNGEFAIIVGSLTAANMIEWQKYIEERRKEKYPDVKTVVVRPCDDLQTKAFEETNTILNAYPNVKLIMAICSPGVPGAAEAVKQAGRKDVKVIGLGLPNDNKQYVHDGITDAVVLWNTMDLGYLTVYAADALANGTLKVGDTSVKAGRLGSLEVKGDNVLLGTPLTFNVENIDKFNF